jgi:hypothetical protein
MSSTNTTSGDHGINGNLNVSNSLTSSGLTISSGNVNFTGATFTNNCIPSAAVSGGGGTTSTTQPNGDNSTNIATTAFVQNAIYPITDITYTPFSGNIYTSVAHNFSIGGNMSIPVNSGVFVYTYDGYSYQTTAFSLIPKLSFLSDMSGSTVQTQLNNLSNSFNNYLTTSNASSTYATISSLSNYLTTSSAASTYAPIANPTFTGTSKTTTPSTSDNSTNIATTAYVQSNLNNLLVNGVYYPFGSQAINIATGYSTYATAYVINSPLYATYALTISGTNPSNNHIKIPLPSATYNGVTINFRHVGGSPTSNCLIYIATTATTSLTVGQSFMQLAANGVATTGWQSFIGSTFDNTSYTCLNTTGTTYLWCQNYQN